jgi:hypothetical protein
VKVQKHYVKAAYLAKHTYTLMVYLKSGGFFHRFFLCRSVQLKVVRPKVQNKINAEMLSWISRSKYIDWPPSPPEKPARLKPFGGGMKMRL